jgi:transcriptional regulator with PAS, ATPase and Fis domain
MARRRILFSWIGHTDIRAAAAELPNEHRESMLRGLSTDTGFQQLRVGQPGPVKALLDAEPFDEAHLLSNYDRTKNRRLLEWIGDKGTLHAVKLAGPTDYDEIFRVVDAELSSVVNLPRSDDVELCFHLSPGTPAMAAVWVLLGKSKYQPVTFYQTHEGKAWVTRVPFDLVVDYVPQVLREADARLQQLASRSPQAVRGFQAIAGTSRGMRLAVGEASRVAGREASVLLLGESGTGKELFARAIHDASPRWDKPFIAINCAALSESLLESELFGHKKGAFTSANQDRDGAFKVADGGTLFLDEVGECRPAMQAMLLRVLQPPVGDPCRRVFQRVGDPREITSNVRIIAATNRDLLVAVTRHEFREDLFYRLSVIAIKLAPLRERREDIPAIALNLMVGINKQLAHGEPGYVHKSISPSAMEFVRKHSWPGNVRQLSNTLMRAAVMSDEPVIERQDIAHAIAEVPGKAAVDWLEHPLGQGFSLENHLDQIQRHYLRRAMIEAGGVKRKAADLLGYRNYQTLAAQLERLRVDLGTS